MSNLEVKRGNCSSGVGALHAICCGASRAVFLSLLAAIALVALAGCSSSSNVDPREQVLQDYVQQQVEDYGYSESEISYEDNGEGDTVFITFRPDDLRSQDIVGYDDAMSQDEARALANELNSFVYIFGYTTDDRLVSTVAAEPPNYDELDEETQADAIQQLIDYQNEYVEFAQANAEEWLGEYVSNSMEYFEGIEDIQFMFDDVTNAYVIMYLWADGYCPVQDDQEAAAGWQWEADYITRATANNVTLLHGTRSAGLQTTYNAGYADNNMLYGYSPSQYSEEGFEQ